MGCEGSKQKTKNPKSKKEKKEKKGEEVKEEQVKEADLSIDDDDPVSPSIRDTGMEKGFSPFYSSNVHFSEKNKVVNCN